MVVFVSGYFGIMSLSKYSMGVFWKKKLVRIILPWLFGSMLIAPFVTYIMLASRHSPMGFWDFYTTLFWGPLYEQAQYWYLGALTALYLMLTAACRCYPSLAGGRDRRLPSGIFFALLFAVAIFSIGIISSYMHPDTWSFYAYILVLQPVRIPLYIAVFFAGAMAWRQRWFTVGGYVPSAPLWSLAFLLSGAIYLLQKFYLPYYGLSEEALIWVNAVCQGTFAISALFFFLGASYRAMNSTSPVLSSLARTSYGVYYLHLPILFCIAWGFVGVDINVYIKYLCVCTLALSVCFLLSRHLLSRLRCFS